MRLDRRARKRVASIVLSDEDDDRVRVACENLSAWMRRVVARRRAQNRSVAYDEDVDDLQRLAKMGEEYGEASELVYKHAAGGKVCAARLREELLDVATAAAMWAEYLRPAAERDEEI